MLTVIGDTATRTSRVLWMLEELGLDYNHEPHRPRSPEVERYNTSGKIPILIDGDDVFTDSTAILHYLADRHNALTYPAGTPERALQDGYTFRILDEIEGPIWMASKHTFLLPEAMRLPAIKESLRWDFGEALRRLSSDLADGPFLMGDQVTVPDIVLAHCLGWARMAKFPADDPVMEGFLVRMMRRPAAMKVFGG